MTTVRGTIFAAKVIHCWGRGMTESFTEKKGGLSTNRLTREQLGAEIGPRIFDLEPHVNREEPKTVTAKAGLAGEIKRAHSEFDTTEILPEAKKQRGAQISGVNASLPTVISLKLTD